MLAIYYLLTTDYYLLSTAYFYVKLLLVQEKIKKKETFFLYLRSKRHSVPLFHFHGLRMKTE